MKLIFAAFLLLVAPMTAQTIAPSQIKPGSNGQVMTTVSGKTAWAPGAASVSSVFGRIGSILPVAGDYNCSQVTGAICSLPSLFNQTVKVDGAAQTQRPSMNFINGNAGTVSCVDNPVTSSTDCTFTGGSSAGITYSIADVAGSRSVNTVYQNTTGSVMFIGGSIGTSGSGVGNVGVAQGPTAFSLPLESWANQATATVSGGDAGFSATIMPGYWYIVQTSGAVNGGVHHWTQITSTGSGGGGGGSLTLTTTGTTGAATLSGGTLNIPQYSANAVTTASPFTNLTAIPVAATSGTRAVVESSFLLDSPNGAIATRISGQAISFPSAITPPIAGISSALSGTPYTVTTHGTLGYVVIAGTPATVATFDLSQAVPVLVGTPYSLPCNNAYGAVYLPKTGATDDSGYLAVACYSTSQIVTLNVSAAGVVTAGASVSGTTQGAIYNNSYDPVNHILYVTGFNNAVLYPVDLTNPLSPTLGSTITLSLGGGGGCLLTGQTAAPGNGYIYVSLGTECGANSEAQVYTAAGTRVGYTALDHAPQRMRMQGKYTYTVEHDSTELQIVDNSTPTAPVLISTLPIPLCGVEDMTMSDAFLYASCDDGGMRKINIENPNRPYVVSTTTGYAGYAAAQAFSTHYLVGVSGTSIVNTDIGGTFSPHVTADAATVRRLEADTIYAKNLATDGPVFGLGYAEWGGSATRIPSSGVVCQWNGSTATNCPPGGGTGTVTTTGSPTSGNMTKFSGATSITNAVAGTDYQVPVTQTIFNSFLPSPGPIGAGTANAATFTALNTFGQV